jgi:hypothetical protein
MTTIDSAPPPAAAIAAPPFSRALRIAAGVCLIAGALLNGLPQLVVHVLSGDLSFDEQIAWGAQHPTAHALEQTALVLSSLVMPVGLLGIAHVTRFHARVLTAIATPLVLWGMWGFANVLAMGYVTGTVAPSVLSVEQAVQLNEGLGETPGVLVTALLPHLVGSFLGLLLLAVAAWRSGAFPRTAAALLVGFLVWDFLLPPLGPVDAHVLLLVAWVWFGVRLLRLPQAVWRGAPTAA